MKATSGEPKRKKPNGKPKSNTSSSHMEVDHGDDGKIALKCRNGKKVLPSLILICGNFNVFHICRHQRCQRILPEHIKNCKKGFDSRIPGFPDSFIHSCPCRSYVCMYVCMYVFD